MLGHPNSKSLRTYSMWSTNSALPVGTITLPTGQSFMVLTSRWVPAASRSPRQRDAGAGSWKSWRWVTGGIQRASNAPGMELNLYTLTTCCAWQCTRGSRPAAY